jgi:hypothetical protein
LTKSGVDAAARYPLSPLNTARHLPVAVTDRARRVAKVPFALVRNLSTVVKRAWPFARNCTRTVRPE